MKYLIFVLCAVLGCGGDVTHPMGDGGIPPIQGLKSIEVQPPDRVLTIQGTTPATQTYKAIGTFEDGHKEDITTRVGFVLGDVSLGNFAGPNFTSQTDHGGVTSVLAMAGNVEGSTGLTLLFKQVQSDPNSMNLPPDPGSKFGGPADMGRAPDLVYPNDGVLVPPNLGKLEFHFHPGNGNTLFELSFENSATDVKVYLRCTALGGGCVYLPDPVVWHWIAETNRGQNPLTYTIRGTDDNGSGVGTSGSQSLSFSKDNINGGLYYWTTSGGTGIMRFDFASNTQTMATRYLTAPAGTSCIGCHALSHDGRKLVAEVNGQNDGRVLLVDVATTTPLAPLTAMAQSIFESWNPAGTQYVGVYGDQSASDFNLLLFDGNTAAKIASIAGTGTASNPADHPDWSPDGMRIVYVQVGIPNTLQKMHEGAIEMITDMGGGAWSAPAELVARQSGKNHYYPAFSPDGAYIVYDESTCSSGGNECNADTDASATLWAIRAQAGAQPVALARANGPGKADGGNTSLTNSFPKWSPFVFQRTVEVGSKLEWMTFSSTRQYGLRPPPPSANPSGESPVGTLIWMAAVDPEKVPSGSDPSFPAFALPFQDLTTSNHIAQWTTVVVPPPQ